MKKTIVAIIITAIITFFATYRIIMYTQKITVNPQYGYIEVEVFGEIDRYGL
jgi:hypothetical protein